MKRILPATPWAEELQLKMFTSRSTKSADPALSGNEKRVFRYMCGEEPSSEEPNESSPSSEKKQLNTKRLFCSRFIRVHQQ
jgi:hypothetical protein